MTRAEMSGGKGRGMIRYDSPEAARIVTVTGWQSRDGMFWGDNEHAARWGGCTHIICACGNVTEKGWTCCEKCRAKLNLERWEKLPLVDWDGGPFCLADGDRYFFDAEDFYDWCEDNDETPSQVRLQITEPVRFSEVDPSHWYDDLPEDGELPDELAEALEVLNAKIRAYKEPACVRPGKGRIVMPDRSEP